MRDSSPVVVVVAHDNPVHFHRLMAAIHPLRTFVHIDASTPADTHARMTEGLPDTVSLLPRLSAGWARYEVLQAELNGYRAALGSTDAEHLIMLTGTDYPLASASAIAEFLSQHVNQSFAEIHPVPRPGWGPTGGADRFWFRQWPWRRHRLVLPIPRRVPQGVVRATGSQLKILSRAHAQYVIEVLDRRPDLLRYFRRCWIPDELVIPSLLISKSLGGPFQTAKEAGPYLWFMDWGDPPSKSPLWLRSDHMQQLTAARDRPQYPALFARKFSDDSGDLLKLIDAELRAVPGPPVE